jgi:hypothetical protein
MSAHALLRCFGLAAALLLGALAGCSGPPETGPVEVKWDRDACARCRMVLSDRHHSAQVRQPLPDGRSAVHKFDDIGCALIWLDDKPWADDPAAEIWVTDHRTGAWIDARTATYVAGQVTPMEYGLGAQPERTPQGLTFAQAKERVFAVEKRFNAHGVHLNHAAHEHESLKRSPGNPDPGPEAQSDAR